MCSSDLSLVRPSRVVERTAPVCFGRNLPNATSVSSRLSITSSQSPPLWLLSSQDLTVRRHISWFWSSVFWSGCACFSISRYPAVNVFSESPETQKMCEDGLMARRRWQNSAAISVFLNKQRVSKPWSSSPLRGVDIVLKYIPRPTKSPKRTLLK